MKYEELERSARHIVSFYQTDDQQELFQIAYLKGLEAIEEGKENVYSEMSRKVADVVAFGSSPVEIPHTGHNRTALAKLRRGEVPKTASELRVAAVMGQREEVLPITVVTTDTPESLLADKQIKQKLQDFLEYDKYYLTEKQREALGVRFYGNPLPEDFMEKYGVDRGSIWYHSQLALEKLRKVLR